MRLLSRPHALLALALLPACDLGPVDRHERLTVDAADLRTLKISAGAGDLTIEGDPAATSVKIVAAIHGEHTTVEHTRVGDTLELSEQCSSWERCGIDWHVVVPAAMFAELDTGAGDIHITGLTGDIVATTGAGDLELRDLASAKLSVETGAGDITGDNLRCPQFKGETGTGDLDLRVAIRPRSVWFSSGAGDVAVAVPAGHYDLDLETGVGDIELADIRRDADADASLRLHTGVGDIDIAGPRRG